MPSGKWSAGAWYALPLLCLCFAAHLGAEDLPRQAMEILAANCFGCHGSDLKMSELDLRTAQSMMKGGERGPALVPGDPDKSRFYRFAAHLEKPSMPPGKKLADWQITVLRRWIENGAHMPEAPVVSTDAKAPLKAMEERPITEQERAFWSFRPVVRPAVPSHKSDWVRNPIDAFLLEKLRQQGLQPSPPANPADSELSARIASYELAYQMQTTALEAVDLARASDATRRLYGLDEKVTEYFGRQCLMARQLVERGVRVVQLYSGGGNFQESWDAHWDLKENHALHCTETDKPIAGLLTDLAARGMLDSTLVIWHSEFGRMPISQRMNGRDHNPYGFTIWMAGGGVKGGTIVGATDEYGYKAVENRKSVNDLHATILHLLGLDHEKLTYPHSGRNMRLTDVAGEVMREVVA